MILTKAPIGAKLQLSFFHSVIGIPILPDDLRYVARMGSERGIGVEMEPKSTFRHTNATHIPTIISLMKVKNGEEFCSLLGDPTRQKRKLKTYEVLTPAIAQEIETSDMTPEGVF